MSFCLENVGNWSPSPQNESELSPRSFESYFPFLQGPSTVSTFSITIPNRIGKKERLKKRETALDRSWRKLRLIPRRGRPISNIFGSKTHANVVKGTFSTDCISDCVGIGRLTALHRCSQYTSYSEHTQEHGVRFVLRVLRVLEYRRPKYCECWEYEQY